MSREALFEIYVSYSACTIQEVNNVLLLEYDELGSHTIISGAYTKMIEKSA